MYRLISTFFLLLLCFRATAQNNNNTVRFAAGNYITGTNISKQTFTKQSIANSLYNDTYFVLIQFAATPSKNILQQLERLGITIEQYLPGNAYRAAVPGRFDFTMAKKLNIISVNSVPTLYKIDTRWWTYSMPVQKKEQPYFAISYSKAISAAIAAAAIQEAGAIPAAVKYTTHGVLYAEADSNIIQAIAALPFVHSITLQGIKDKPLNYKSIAVSGISTLHHLNGRNLKGKNISIGIGDNADISTHIDFAGRLINRSPWIPEQHGTHVAGTVGGGGILNPMHQGMAPKATLINQFFSDIIVNTPAYITDHGMVLTNNSYYTSDDGCPGNGSYDELSRYADVQTKQYEQVLHVVASGNDGSQTCTPQPASYGTVKSGWQAAKNVLTVGAYNAQDYSIANFSSRGPMKDGRLKPEITAPGWAITSTNTNNGYTNMWGTSMSCPVVTGAMALLYERYRALHAGANPKAALIKAIACNTAEDLGTTGPDYTFGFGMLNARRAVEAIENNRYFISTIANSGSNNHIINVPAGAQQLKVMLYWAEPAAATNAANTLVNDLDIRIITPSAALRRPLVLNPDPAHVTDMAAEGTDRTNNIEQVVITNPETGNHTININGFNIPVGTQEYIVTYEIIMPSVQLEYPAGGETLVPGQPEVIRWSAYGSEANPFTLEYSADNGSTWTLIDNSVAANSRSYSWTVPAGATNNALIRISANNTPLNSSSQPFSLLGQPVITASKICEGTVALSWNTVAAATSYDILQLNADSMQVIANTTNNTFTVSGLNKYSSYWFSVAAKNATQSGRRSVAVNVIPNSGGCTDALFNNDLKVDSILEPNTARQQFAHAANATAPVKINIRNLGTVATSGNYTVSYSYMGTTVTENLNTSIAPGATVTHTFSTAYSIIPEGFKYDFKAWVTHPLDNNHANDTAYKTVKFINNDVVTLPLTETFEAMPAGTFIQNEMAIGNNKHIDFSSNTPRGRARTFVNSGFAYEGSKALTLDQAPYSENSNTDTAILNYNLQPYSNSQLRFDFFYKNHSQADAPGNKVWIRGSENNNWVEAYNLYENQAITGGWKKALVNINEVLLSATPAQTVSNTFQIKLGQEGNNSANHPSPEIDLDDGYTFDNLSISLAENDIAVTQILSPDKSSCALSANTPVTIRLKNYSNNTLSNISVHYRLGTGPVVSETIATLAANTSIDYSFAQTANLAEFTGYTLQVWAKYDGDTYAANDSILNYTLYNSPLISNYPYYENFETSNGNFYTAGLKSSWQWGAPIPSLKTKLITKAASGQNAWVTNLTGNHANSETSYLVTPCFQLDDTSNMTLSFSHIYELEKDYDYSWVEYSTDGMHWHKLGNGSNGTNWYNDIASNAWNDTDDKWHVASFDIPVKSVTIRFRFVLSSDAGVTKEGVGIDDVRLHRKSLIDISLPAAPAITLNTNWPNDWVPFTYYDNTGNTWVTEGAINTHGQALGTITVTPKHYSGNDARHSNNQYYLNKNFIISSTTPPAGPVSVRLYFTDIQSNQLINATGCSNCAVTNDAYELAITRYKGSATEEDGALANNTDGYYQHIPAAGTTIVPHGNGYYAECTTNGFGEFWISKGNITPAATKACVDSAIFFTATVKGNTYQWQVNTGSGYTNISNNIFYTGSTTQQLQITNTPASFMGYRYRCIINGTLQDSEFTLRFKNIWSGTADTNWFNPANWSCGSIPNATTDVVIPGGLINYPTINAAASVRNIRVQEGATCTVLPGISFDIKGQ
ncbi:MAG TPA: S8 family serine peptidase [Ferruginibacter sp.]|nr:S8 family serine peptidase [Ferruginibacter sp.]